MWPKRFFPRLVLTYSLIIVTTLILVGTYLVLRESRTTREQLVDQLSRLAAVIDERLTSEPPDPTSLELQQLVRTLSHLTMVRITWIAPDGTVMADSQGNHQYMENHMFRPEVQMALAQGFGSSLRLSSTTKENYLYVAIPSRHRVDWIIRVALPFEQYDSQVSASTNVLFLATLLAALISIMAGYFFTRRATRPLEQIVGALESMGRGELDVKVDETKLDEDLLTLAHTFNHVQAQVETTIESLTSQRNQREAILSSMVEGVLATDAEERVILMNESAQQLLRIDGSLIEGRPLFEIVRQPDVLDFVRRVCGSDVALFEELVVRDPDRRWLQLNGAPLRIQATGGSGAVVVFNDVTRLRRLEQSRKDFVGNVSHELKTPITTIRGFLETLVEGGALEEPESAIRFLRIIAKHTDRLQNIVDDLLYLSRLEYEDAEIDRHPLNLSLIVMTSVGTFEPIAKERKISLAVHIAEQPINVLGNSSLLMRALDNLIDNALKYNNEGGHVDVLLHSAAEIAIITVKDDGLGIPEQHLSRISERFYRVDSGRSREMGGTGLGLAIAKHVSHVHGGTLKVESRLGEGSSFSIRLPRNT